MYNYYLYELMLCMNISSVLWCLFCEFEKVYKFVKSMLQYEINVPLWLKVYNPCMNKHYTKHS